MVEAFFTGLLIVAMLGVGGVAVLVVGRLFKGQS